MPCAPNRMPKVGRANSVRVARRYSSRSPAGTFRHPCMLAYVAELSRVQAQYEVALSEQQALREDNERWRQRVQRLLDRHEVSEAILSIDR